MDDSLLFWVNQSYLLYVKYVFKSAKAMDAYVTSIMKQYAHMKWKIVEVIPQILVFTCRVKKHQKHPETKNNNDLVQMHDLRPGFQDKTI